MNCKKATALSVKSAEEKLNRSDRFKLAFHLFICSYCRIFDKQNKLINAALRKRSDYNTLTAEEKESLRIALKNSD